MNPRTQLDKLRQNLDAMRPTGARIRFSVNIGEKDVAASTQTEPRIVTMELRTKFRDDGGAK